MIYVTVCRDVDQGIEWAKVRDATDDWLEKVAGKLQISAGALDPDMWGLQPDQIAAAERALRMGGDVGG